MLKGVPDRLRSEVWSDLLSGADPAAGNSDLKFKRGKVMCDLAPLLLADVRFLETRDACRGYCQSMNYVAGLLLLVFNDVTKAYSAFVVFMRVFALSGLYVDGLPLTLSYSFATLRRMKDSMPDLHDHFWRVNFRFPQFPCAWFMSSFVKLLPLPLVKRFWDLLVLEGGDVLVTLCVITLKTLRPFFLCLEQDDLWKFLDFVRMPRANSWLERFWLQLFDQQLAGDNSVDEFQREHHSVRAILSSTPLGSIEMDSLCKDFSYPSALLAIFHVQGIPFEASPLPRSAPTMEASSSASTAPSTASTREAPVLSRWEAARQTISAVSVEMSWEMRDGMIDGMRRLNKILARPERRSGAVK
eukprot:Skav226460  [mRNA]  locus=scaffold1781:70217:74836:+ [translate_table: standard]